MSNMTLADADNAEYTTPVAMQDIEIINMQLDMQSKKSKNHSLERRFTIGLLLHRARPLLDEQAWLAWLTERDMSTEMAQALLDLCDAVKAIERAEQH